MDNQRLIKARQAYEYWNEGNGDEGELAIALYDLAADYEALLKDFAQLEQQVERLEETVKNVADELGGHINEEPMVDSSLDWCYDTLRAALAQQEEA